VTGDIKTGSATDLTIVRTETHSGFPYVRWSDGTLLPVVRGGDGPVDDPKGKPPVDDEDDSDDEPKGKPPVDDGVPPAVRAALRKANKEAETLRLELKKRDDADKSESQKLTERAEAAERRASELERQTMRARVGSAKGLPPKMWDRLVGDDEDALKADADELLAEMKPNGSRPSLDGGAKPRNDPGTPDMNSLIRGALRRS
jgi:hypothetical protein